MAEQETPTQPNADYVAQWTCYREDGFSWNPEGVNWASQERVVQGHPTRALPDDLLAQHDANCPGVTHSIYYTAEPIPPVS